MPVELLVRPFWPKLVEPRGREPFSPITPYPPLSGLTGIGMNGMDIDVGWIKRNETHHIKSAGRSTHYLPKA
jgi:hypothetical protein